MLPTPKSTLEPSTSHHSMPESASSLRPHYPSCKIVRDISTSNIQEGKRVRKPSEKARQQTYLVALNSSEDLQACYTAFATGTQHWPGKIHCNDLPDPPNSWFELQTHQYREEFKQAAEKKYKDLFHQNTFEKVEQP